MKPIYDIKVNKDNKKQGLFTLSIVRNPAIKEMFVKLSEESIQTKLSSLEKKQVVGAALIPDMPINRQTKELGEFQIKFSKETIEDILLKYSKDSNMNKFNVEHKFALGSDDATMLEMWIKESNNDKSTDFGFEDLPVGTLFFKLQIENDVLWDSIKEGELNGFSVEILSDLITNENMNLSEQEDFAAMKAKMEEMEAKLKSYSEKEEAEALAIKEKEDAEKAELAKAEEERLAKEAEEKAALDKIEAEKIEAERIAKEKEAAELLAKEEASKIEQDLEEERLKKAKEEEEARDKTIVFDESNYDQKFDLINKAFPRSY